MPNRLYLLASTDKTQHAALRAHPGAAALGRGRQARRLAGLDVDLAVEDATAELQERRPASPAAPAQTPSLADNSAAGRLSPVEMNDFHPGFVPNELAGIHEGAVPPGSQAISFRKPVHRIFCGE
jgi:hypothetical protein